jgi:hypothetical protein
LPYKRLTSISKILGEQKYNPQEKKMASSPAQVDFNAIKLILEA